MSFFSALTYKPGTNTALPLTKILASDKCAYSWFSRTRVLSDSGYTYIGVVADFGTGFRSGLVQINESDNSVTGISLSSDIEQDDHNETAILKMDNNKYIAAYCEHDSANIVRWRVSTNANDGSTWDAEQTKSLASGFKTTYAELFKASDGTIFYFFRVGGTAGSSRGWYYMKSTDNGVTFGTPVQWHNLEDVSYIINHQSGDNIHIVASDHPYVDLNYSDNAICYGIFDLNTETFYNEPGKTTTQAFPVNFRNAAILDTSTSPDELWIEDIGIDSSGYPRILYTKIANVPSPNWGPVKVRWYIEWNGSAWSTPYNMGEYQSVWSEIPEEGINIQRNVFTDPSNIVSSPEYSSVGRFNDRDADQMFIHKQVGSKTELFKVVRNASNDFTWTQLTFGSTHHQWRANSIPSGPYNLYWLNARDYRDMKNYDMDLYIGIL